MQRAHTNDHLIKRLVYGRMVMLNRGMNLFRALDSIFSLPEEELQNAVSMACEQYGHRPNQIAQQLQELDSSLFAFVPHQVLAQRNMLVMNKVGVNVLSKPEDHPDWRSWFRRASTSGTTFSPFAELVVQPYLDMTSPDHNNIRRDVVDIVGEL
jgi:hypothetical protein